MKYATYEHAAERRVGEVRGDVLVPLDGITEIGVDTPTDVLANATRLESRAVAVADVRILPVVPNPTKILCVGLNYKDHIAETGRDTPTYPVMFAKYASNLLGATDDIALPPESSAVDYEGELAVVIGRGGRRIAELDALDHVLGFAAANDITMRDFQYKTHQWIQGKAWDASTPVGPYVVTPDEIDLGACGIRTIVNGTTVQDSDLSQLLFTVENLVATISTFTRLEPGDIILTGTPGGVGFRKEPKLLLQPGDDVRVEIDNIGTVSNAVVVEKA
ncbi:fumarylacetoacetate hydrolase family protein [Rhodococcus sp. NPDC003318]|uniref:fumarylacetoacetate hydrolase family protein n=1 Tax=Rhodococcus sp. NPDC003318 TaxID=3364503 RepID=UPI0036C7785C